jgi:NMD protein affecting ribosome stability and mRNA decay
MKALRPRGFHKIRRDKLMFENVEDTYKLRAKLPEPTRCPQCGAVYHEGRWQWLTPPPSAHEETCPACHRIHDHYPAGFVTLGGDFFVEHREEILSLVRNQKTRERAEHPFKRIMKIENQAGGVLITTTDIHLARGIGDALHHAYQGELDFHYNKEDNLLRVSWTR